MDQDSANYLTSDSSFNVPIILNSEGLESFGAPIIEDDDEARIQETAPVDALNDRITEGSNLECVVNNAEFDESLQNILSEQTENKSTPNQNLKVFYYFKMKF